eukprot:INCI12610.1.p1 GENE.INCI12610.1~~INCI12610.1.p1  ORF type:complete len:404 (-),score=51.99 INCI12610.1:808-2019(-)
MPDAGSASAAAAAAATATVSPVDLLMSFLGGLTFFLYGLNKLSTSMKRLAGKRMKRVIVRLTSNSCVGLLVGMVVTGVSSSLTLVSVLLVGFVGTGLLQFEKTIPVLMGAGIGSTLISLLVALKVTKYGLLLIAGSYFYSSYAKRKLASRTVTSGNNDSKSNDHDHAEPDTTKVDVADCVFGLGLIFYGSQVMGGTFAFLGSSPTFVSFLERLHNPFLGLLTGFVLTTMVNSSGAAMGILLSLSEHGLLDGRAGIAMVLGANVGTCVTACVAGFSQGRGPLEVATALVLVRTVGALAFTAAISPLQHLASMACGVSSEADLALLAREPGHIHPTQQAALDVSCQIAASHTIFNLLIALLVVAFVRPYARVVRAVVSIVLGDHRTPARTSSQRSAPPSLEITVV